MPQIFHRRANALVPVVLGGAAFVLFGISAAWIALGGSPYSSGVGSVPEQPVPFSHKHHVGRLGLDCRYCHTSVEQSTFAGMPATTICMTCHSQLWTHSEMLAPVRQSLKRNEPIRWVRVYDLADFVYFSHRSHVSNGVGCESCHGRVDKMPLMRQATPLQMEWCLSCHQNPAPHLRPRYAVTIMGYEPREDEIPGEVLMRRYDIDPDHLTECVTCHR